QRETCVKLFKRAAKDTEQNLIAPAAKPPRRSGNDQQALLPGAIAALAGLLLGGALLAFDLSGNAQRQQQRLIAAWGGSQAGNPAVLAALQSGDRALIDNAERSLQHWQGVIDAHLNLPGQASLNVDRSGPMNCAALDLLRRLENGQAPAVEAYKVGERWLAY